jgi:hypothetical protein
MNTRTREVDHRRRLSAWIALAPLLVFCAGCPFAPVTDVPGGSARSDIDTPGNASIRDATALPLGPTDEFEFRGSIDNHSDIDVFDLGILSPGDRLFVDIQTANGDLDPVAAIFDSREYLVAYNDDREPDGSDLDPQIDIVIPGDEGRYYLGVIAYPGYTSSGEYDAIVRVQRNVGLIPTRGQIVLLNWAGGDNVAIPNVGTFDLPRFSATDVGLSSSRTEELKDRVQAVVADRYAAFDFTLLNSDDHPVPSDPHVTVHFGGSNRRAFAISEKIDTFNADPGDEAIVFTESFIGAFGPRPTFEQMAEALGNTAAHEIAHLLGLVHTADCDSLMDASCSNVRILSPQEFQTAELDQSVFPFGFQPAEEILEWVLGLVGL